MGSQMLATQPPRILDFKKSSAWRREISSFNMTLFLWTQGDLETQTTNTQNRIYNNSKYNSRSSQGKSNASNKE